MSYISDYLKGYMDDEEFRQISAEENRWDRGEQEHEFDEQEGEEDDEDGIENRIRHIYNCGYQQGYEDGKNSYGTEIRTKQDVDEAYQSGLEDAWECGKRIANETSVVLSKIFGEVCASAVFQQYSPQEAVKKIKEYEERHTEDAYGKKEKPTLDDLWANIKKWEEEAEQEPKSPCDLCMYNPPSSADGKPCTMCPAEKGE